MPWNRYHTLLQILSSVGDCRGFPLVSIKCANHPAARSHHLDAWANPIREIQYRPRTHRLYRCGYR